MRDDADLITSVRVVPTPMHDHVFVWNRHGHSGQLVVCKGDGDSVALRLLPEGELREEMGARVYRLPGLELAFEELPELPL